MGKVINSTLGFILEWYWVGTIEKFFWSAFITEGLWCMRFSLGAIAVPKETLETVTFQSLEYLEWVATVRPI